MVAEEKTLHRNVPNAKTKKAIAQARKGKVAQVKSFAALCKELGIYIADQ